MKFVVDEDGLAKHRAKEIRRERCLELQGALSEKFEELRTRDIPSQFMTIELTREEVNLLKEFNLINEDGEVLVHYSDSLVRLPYSLW